MAMENGPFIDDFPMKPAMYKGFSVALIYQKVISCNIHRIEPVLALVKTALVSASGFHRALQCLRVADGLLLGDGTLVAMAMVSSGRRYAMEYYLECSTVFFPP